jgi:hypothetical protein
MSKASKASKGSSGSKTHADTSLAQNIELQITQIVSEKDINSDNILHDDVGVSGSSSETKKQKKMAAKLSKLNFGGSGSIAEKTEEKLAGGKAGADEERRLTENMELIASYRKNKNTWINVKCPSMLPYIETPWTIIGAYFNKQQLKPPCRTCRNSCTRCRAVVESRPLVGSSNMSTAGLISSS